MHTQDLSVRHITCRLERYMANQIQPEKIDKNTFGGRLYKKIEEIYGTQKEFAKVAGICRPALLLYIKNERHPNTLVLAEICKALNVSADYLLFGEGKR